MITARAGRFHSKLDALTGCQIEPGQYAVSSFSQTVIRFSLTFSNHEAIRKEREHANADCFCKHLARENRARSRGVTPGWCRNFV